MQVSLNWINELINLESVNLNDFINKLTLGGFEVEEIKKVTIENETQLILDVSATANRSDSLSIQGLSSEITILLKKSLKISSYSLKPIAWKKKTKQLSTTLPENEDCSAFISVIVENLNNFKSPKWIQQKLISCGIIVTDTLLDFENYILLETGYTFALYDFSKICNKLKCAEFTLSLSKGDTNDTFIGSNESRYQLDSSTTVIRANHLPISIAGIITNNDYSYSKNTNCLLIEASIFEAAKIRQQSRHLGLRTNRSARYEKSLKDKYLIESLYRLLSLLRISNSNLTVRIHTIAQKPAQDSQIISLNYQTVKEILGPITLKNQEKTINYITPETITEYLNRLNFEFLYNKSKLIWEVQVPDLRTDDITREIDLIEEIGRLHGFNNFLVTLPKTNHIGTEDFTYKTKKKITSCLLNLGFNELIHYSLVNEITFSKNNLKLINPLLSECSNLRSSLLPNLIKTAHENLKQGNTMIEGFEYGHVFSKNTFKNFIEKECLAGIFGGIKKKLDWSNSEQVLTWFEAKGKVEQLFKQLNISICWQIIKNDDNKILHPYRSVEIYLTNGKKLGVFGQIHPILADQLTFSPNIYLFELEIDLIQQQIQNNKLTPYKKYSSYPKIIKNLSFIISTDISFQEIQQFLEINGTQFLSEVNLLDEYMGQPIPNNKKSLCLQLVFQSQENTLENKQIEIIINNLQLILTNQFEAMIRN